MARVAIDARGLRVSFGGMQALRGVDFRVEEGELRCLIGPNGAGKSTLFQCLSGQLHPDGGNIWMGAENTGTLLPHQIARLGVGIKTQVPSVMEALSVAENLQLAARGGDIGEIMERTAITAFADTPPAGLAHGQRQMVEFAMVMAQRPWLVLLDEPAAGMTGGEAARLAQLIMEMRRTASIVVVEHDMHFVRRIANQVTVLDRGRVLMEDHVSVVLNNDVVRDVYLGRRR